VVATIFKNSIAEFDNNGIPSGVIYIEGFRGTVSTASAGSIGNLSWSRLNSLKADAVPTAGTTSGNCSIWTLVDTSWTIPVSGTKYPILWRTFMTTAASAGMIFGDFWTAT
jgi:hypothetical protein